MMKYTISTNLGESTRMAGQYDYAMITLCGPTKVKANIVNQ